MSIEAMGEGVTEAELEGLLTDSLGQGEILKIGVGPTDDFTAEVVDLNADAAVLGASTGAKLFDAIIGAVEAANDLRCRRMVPNHHLRVGERVVVLRGPYSEMRGHVTKTFPDDWYEIRSGSKLIRIFGNDLEARTLNQNRKWSSSYVSDLPDSAFLWIDPTTGERKLPYKDKTGKIDYAHLKNALARLAVTDMPEKARAAVRRKAEALIDREFPPG